MIKGAACQQAPMVPWLHIGFLAHFTVEDFLNRKCAPRNQAPTGRLGVAE
jgi:hypothetical protein